MEVRCHCNLLQKEQEFCASAGIYCDKGLMEVVIAWSEIWCILLLYSYYKVELYCSLDMDWREKEESRILSAVGIWKSLSNQHTNSSPPRL